MHCALLVVDKEGTCSFKQARVGNGGFGEINILIFREDKWEIRPESGRQISAEGDWVFFRRNEDVEGRAWSRVREGGVKKEVHRKESRGGKLGRRGIKTEAESGLYFGLGAC